MELFCDFYVFLKLGGVQISLHFNTFAASLIQAVCTKTVRSHVFLRGHTPAL